MWAAFSLKVFMQLLNQTEIQAFLVDAGVLVTFGLVTLYALDYFNENGMNASAYDTVASGTEFIFMFSTKDVLSNGIANAVVFTTKDTSLTFHWKVVNNPDHLGDGFTRVHAIRTSRVAI
jgi:hypothetical protein